jgi:hypothetical protein
MALTAVAAPQPAQAGHGGAVAAGVIGGLAAGAIIGSAVAHGPYYAYAPGPVYYGPRCYWHRERVWTHWGWRWSRVRVCR